MSDLSPAARRRSLQLKLRNIRRKIERVEAEVRELEGQTNPARRTALFDSANPALDALRAKLGHLREVERKLKKELSSPR